MGKNFIKCHQLDYNSPETFEDKETALKYKQDENVLAIYDWPN